MTFQPPPSEPPGAYPPPPPGAGGAFDPKAVNPLDWGIIGAGALAFIFSFFDWYTIDVTGFGSGGESAWHGFFGWFAVLCAIAGAGVVATALFSPQTKLPFPNRLIGLVLFAVATLSVILALLVFPEDVPDVKGVDTGRGIGFWLGAIVIIGGLVLSLMRFQATGGQLPGGLQGKVPDISGYGPQDRPGSGAGQGPISGTMPAPNPAPSPGPRPGFGQQPPPPPASYGQQPPPPPPSYGQQPPPPSYGPPQ